MADSSNVGVIILAAGSSRRLGRPKQLLVREGKTLLQHVVDRAVEAAVGPVVVVLGSAAEEIEAGILCPSEVTIVRNPDYESGQASSLRAGLAALGADRDRGVVLLGDQPQVSSDTIRRVAFGPGLIRRARYRDAMGHPVAFDRQFWDELGALSGDHGARFLLAAHEVVAVDVDADSPKDVDTEEDARALGFA